MPSLSGSEPLTRGERWGLRTVLAVVILFGVLVELRSAFQHSRKTDLGVYLRAAWAVRTGAADPYSVIDDNGWHYCYPPLLAVVLTPLADPPGWLPRAGFVPFAVSVALWYVFSVGCLWFGVHRLASALEATSPDPTVRNQPPQCRRWWYLRLVPVLLCLPAVGCTLSRGQVNLLLLALLCAAVAAAIRGRRWAAGLWLSGAICLKLIPAFLLLLPIWRRDRRWLTGCAAGLLVGLVLIPSVCWGPTPTWAAGREMLAGLVLPALTGAGNQSRAKELIEMTATDNQSFQAVMHYLQHWDRATRPPLPDTFTRVAPWLLGCSLTLLTLRAGGRARETGGARLAVQAGGAIVIMVMISPVCHLHYFCFALPLGMGLLALAWERSGSMRTPVWLVALFAAHLALSIPPYLQNTDALRDSGMAMFATLALWGAGVIALRRGAGRTAAENGERAFSPLRTGAAA